MGGGGRTASSASAGREEGEKRELGSGLGVSGLLRACHRHAGAEKPLNCIGAIPRQDTGRLGPWSLDFIVNFF